MGIRKGEVGGGGGSDKSRRDVRMLVNNVFVLGAKSAVTVREKLSDRVGMIEKIMFYVNNTHKIEDVW